ncbi:MAG: DUF2986 domain-containing protein [Colwellia sp.]
MNRKKKMNNMLKKKLKKANAKLHSNNKAKYVSKADRAKLTVQLESQREETEQGT